MTLKLFGQREKAFVSIKLLTYVFRRKGEYNLSEFPQIDISFVVEGKNFNLEQLTEEINILPTDIRKQDDWPVAIKNNKHLPANLQPRCIWCISQKENSCRQIEIPIRKIISQLRGREKLLNEFCMKNNLKKVVSITIQGDAMNLPEIVLSADIVSYFGWLGVEISFDIYTY